MRRTIQKWMWFTGIVLAMAVCAAGALSQTKEATQMNPKPVQEEGFTVMGIAIRTSNAEQMTEVRPIGKQWERLFREGVRGAIPNRADGNILAVYSEYASDKDGEYTYLLGARVTKVENVPAGMTVKKVLAGKYAVFTSERGPVQKVVVEMWRRVWATPKNVLGGERSYKTDFEVYDQRAQNPADSVVDLHVSVK